MKIIGVSRRTYNGPGWEPTDIVVALVEGDIEDYAAYIAIGRDETWAAQHGNKLRFEEACCHFPGGQLVREKYRV